ncbi:hypothetical protein G8O24_40570 [Bradyrhizobium sp. INPA01-394B]|uniref:Uncharacterized protein n=1 Tax=Bradyrhizobium campsiandrae TaxID=1729892 RepID=A0ABR7UIM1_9BRAD|nr:hypothetical protein [Bradyrhizobium campsiandrae]MBC9883583.1 hypothetical protein [Bradyrhizobium campsiandrae]MBC9983446.1 hypothetical protein [Bradyrhizobium campsiandrae]
MSFFAVGQWVKRDLAGQAGTFFTDNAGNVENGACYAQKGNPAISTGYPMRLRRNIGKKRQKTMRSLRVG